MSSPNVSNVLSVRNFPSALKKQLKIEAAKQGIPLERLIRELLAKAIEAESSEGQQ